MLVFEYSVREEMYVKESELGIALLEFSNSTCMTLISDLFISFSILIPCLH